MTTIAVNTSSMACDLQFTHASGLKFKGKTKVLYVGPEVCNEMFKCEEAYIGFAGNSSDIGEIVTWFCDVSEKPPKCRDIEMLLLNEKGKIFHSTNLRNWIAVDNKYFSIGSGMEYAMGAMAAGKTPIEAVKIAGQLDKHTGMGYKSYSFE